jgi:outer membrane lipoprotein-sorting protein
MEGMTQMSWIIFFVAMAVVFVAGCVFRRGK